MSPKSLFLIVLKVLGLVFVRELIQSIVQIITVVQFMGGNSGEETIRTLTYYLVFITIYTFAIRMLLFRTNWVLDKLKLDQGFDEQSLGITISFQDVLQATILVIAGLMLCEEIPALGRHIYTYKRQSELNYGTADSSYVIGSVCKIILALLLIGERGRILAFIDKNEAKKRSADDKGPLA